MKTGLKLKNSQVSPRKISVLFRQVPAATAIPINVCKASTTQFAVQQKRA
jgi:hypothetical protein